MGKLGAGCCAGDGDEREDRQREDQEAGTEPSGDALGERETTYRDGAVLQDAVSPNNNSLPDEEEGECGERCFGCNFIEAKRGDIYPGAAEL